MSEYKYYPHYYGPICKGAKDICCKHCGLVPLNNEISRWADKMGCLHMYHKDYKSKLKRAAG